MLLYVSLICNRLWFMFHFVKYLSTVNGKFSLINIVVTFKEVGIRLRYSHQTLFCIDCPAHPESVFCIVF